MHQWCLLGTGASREDSGQDDHMVAHLPAASAGLCHGLAFEPGNRIGDQGSA